MSFLLQFLQFLFKPYYILKFPVDRSKPYVCHFVKGLELFHYNLSYNLAIHFHRVPFPQVGFNFINELLYLVKAYRPFFACLQDSVKDFLPFKPLPLAFFLHDNNFGFFNPFISCEPFIALQAFSSSPCRFQVLSLPCINDLGLLKAAVRAFHKQLDIKERI